MASSESLSPLTPHEAAAAVGVGVQSIRRWCEWHAAHLSPGANPGAGMPRRLVARDVEVLKEVKDLRYQGLQTEAINERLAGLTFPEVENIQIIDTPGLNENNVLDAPSSLQDAQQAFLTPVRLLDDLEKRMDAKFEALEQRTRPPWWWLVAGIGIGLGLALAFELAALVASRGH